MTICTSYIAFYVKVRIVGKDRDAVDSARRQLEFVIEK
jgi:hypothetical protein